MTDVSQSGRSKFVLPEEVNPQLEGVQFELRSTGLKEVRTSLRSGIHTRGYLPHVKREGASYFVTFRLADSLPEQVVFKIQQRRAEALARISKGQPLDSPTHSETVSAIERDYFRAMEAYLDKGVGSCRLKSPDVARLVSDALLFFNDSRYQLKSWVVMPNHVHVVVWPIPNYTLSSIIRSWKGYTAFKINQLHGRRGRRVWQPEPYDHWIRNEVECERCCRYVIWNPVKAGFCRLPQEWRWSSAYRPPTS